MLLIVSPNLCLDRIIVVRGFTTGRVHRAESVAELASGKGLNVARTARLLGVDVLVVGLLGGGSASRAFVQDARDHGVAVSAVRVPGPLRICTLVVDPGREETVINEPGPEVDADAGRKLLVRMSQALKRARAVILAGSLPPGVPPTFYADAIRQARPIPTILDAAGEALRLGMDASPYLVKANQQELLEAMGRPLENLDSVMNAAEEVRRTSGGSVLVTLGNQGALMVTADGNWHLVPPEVERVNTIGAGDSLTAGLAAGVLQGLPLVDAARLGIAAAAADVTTLLPGTVDPALVAQLIPRVDVRAAQ